MLSSDHEKGEQDDDDEEEEKATRVGTNSGKFRSLFGMDFVELAAKVTEA